MNQGLYQIEGVLECGDTVRGFMFGNNGQHAISEMESALRKRFETVSVSEAPVRFDVWKNV